MRIAILADPLDNQNAGIHVYTREMVHALIRMNPGHEIFLIREKHDHELEGAMQVAIPNTRLPIGFASLRLFFLAPAAIRRIKADVVIEPAHFGPFNLRSGIKRVTVIHDLTPILFPEMHRWHSQFLQKVFLKRILGKADLIITNSDNTSKDVCEVYPENCEKVRRIYPGVSDLFQCNNKPDVLEKYGINAPYFLSVGTIEPRKNLDVLLKAYELFMEAGHASVNLVVTGGKGWKSDSFFKLLDQHKFRERIVLTNYVDAEDLPALYSNAMALIYPSKYEGFGLPVAEAMKCGCPVITSDISSLPEVGGETVLYAPTGDATMLSEQMLRIASDEDLRSKLSAEGRSRVAMFNWDSFAVEFWKSLEDLNQQKCK